MIRKPEMAHTVLLYANLNQCAVAAAGLLVEKPGWNANAAQARRRSGQCVMPSWAEWVRNGTGEMIHAIPDIHKSCLLEISSDTESPRQSP